MQVPKLSYRVAKCKIFLSSEDFLDKSKFLSLRISIACGSPAHQGMIEFLSFSYNGKTAFKFWDVNIGCPKVRLAQRSIWDY